MLLYTFKLYFQKLVIGRIFDGAIDDQFGELGTIRRDGIMERAL
jgi:hypothetical protein